MNLAFTAWSFGPGLVPAASESTVAEAAQRILYAGLLPPSEHHDARILSEAAPLDCLLLVSDDSEVRAVDLRRLGVVLAPFGLRPPTIVTSRELVKFYR